MDVDCPRCGKFRTDRNGIEATDEEGKKLARYLPAVTRQSSAQGEPVDLTEGNWRALASRHCETSPSEQKRKLLKLFAGRADSKTAEAKLDHGMDFPLIDAVSPEEVLAWAQELEEERLLRDVRTRTDVEGTGRLCLTAVVTGSGWEAVKERPGSESGVFISHVGIEKEFALRLKIAIHEAFGADFPVFVSSDPKSIGGGKVWFEHIRGELRKAKVVLVLVSQESAKREWINFEAGFGDGARACVIPVLIRDYGFNELDFPLKGFQGRRINDITHILHDIATQVGLSAPTDLDEQRFVGEVRSIAAGIPSKGIALQPVMFLKAGSSRTLRFRLSNTGDTDVELIEVEAAVPKSVLVNQAWSANYIPSVLSPSDQVIDDEPCVVLKLHAFQGSVDRYEHGPFQPLPPVFAPGMSMRLLDGLQFPIKLALSTTDQRKTILRKIVARGLNAKVEKTLLGDIPVEENP